MRPEEGARGKKARIEELKKINPSLIAASRNALRDTKNLKEFTEAINEYFSAIQPAHRKRVGVFYIWGDCDKDACCGARCSSGAGFAVCFGICAVEPFVQAYQGM
ncbi:MAG: hypothetical protein ACLUKN_06590 [Bacilli bacterium]